MWKEPALNAELVRTCTCRCVRACVRACMHGWLCVGWVFNAMQLLWGTSFSFIAPCPCVSFYRLPPPP
jgi:hypothetical protein